MYVHVHPAADSNQASSSNSSQARELALACSSNLMGLSSRYLLLRFLALLRWLALLRSLALLRNLALLRFLALEHEVKRNLLLLLLLPGPVQFLVDVRLFVGCICFLFSFYLECMNLKHTEKNRYAQTHTHRYAQTRTHTQKHTTNYTSPPLKTEFGCLK